MFYFGVLVRQMYYLLVKVALDLQVLRTTLTTYLVVDQSRDWKQPDDGSLPWFIAQQTALFMMLDQNNYMQRD